MFRRYDKYVISVLFVCMNRFWFDRVETPQTFGSNFYDVIVNFISNCPPSRFSPKYVINGCIMCQIDPEASV